MARNCREFCRKWRLSSRFWVLLHAVNLRHGADGFTSPPKEGVLKFFQWEIINRHNFSKYLRYAILVKKHTTLSPQIKLVTMNSKFYKVVLDGCLFLILCQKYCNLQDPEFPWIIQLIKSYFAIIRCFICIKHDRILQTESLQAPFTSRILF